MSRKSTYVAALIGLLLAVPGVLAYGASTSVVVRLRPGIGIPKGDFANATIADAGSGLQMGGALEILMRDKVAIGIEGGWMRNKSGSEGKTLDLGGGTSVHQDEDRFTTTHFGASGRYVIPVGASKVHPNVQLGLGAYSMKEKWANTTTAPSGTTTLSGEDKFGSRFGWRLGLGADYDVTSAVGLGVDVDYTSISMDAQGTYGSGKAPFVGVAGVVTYKFSKSH